MELVNPFNIFKSSPKKIVEKITDQPASLPRGRSSVPDFVGSLNNLKKSLEFVKEDDHKTMVPFIRNLLKINSTLGLAVYDSVQLCNPGYRILFDNDVKPEQAIKMRRHLENAAKRWAPACAGIHGIINKMMYQIFIGGALSNEWIINNELNGIHAIGFVRPENIKAAYSKRRRRFEYYQQVSGGLPFAGAVTIPGNYKKLNPLTYRYFELINDLEEPVGIPPFLSVLSDLSGQRLMLDNINLVVEQYGVMGFLELLLKKPQPKDGEGDGVYRTRLEKLLTDSKSAIKDGLKDGVVVGFENDHTFDFHSISKDINGVKDIFDINHAMVSNGLFTSPGFLGGSVGGSETHINIIFTKMLSQLKNMQTIIKSNFEFGMWLELNLAGMPVEKVNLQFDKSTITDELKQEQAREIAIRNDRVLYADGQIGQTQYANNQGYDKPDKPEPRVEIDPNKIAGDAKKSEEREKSKDTSDRKVRDKNKPQPKRKAQDTKK